MTIAGEERSLAVGDLTAPGVVVHGAHSATYSNLRFEHGVLVVDVSYDGAVPVQERYQDRAHLDYVIAAGPDYVALAAPNSRAAQAAK